LQENREDSDSVIASVIYNVKDYSDERSECRPGTPAPTTGWYADQFSGQKATLDRVTRHVGAVGGPVVPLP
jgi:hypothetical protein|tara:strand:- start:8467 stop:8679 length:213 start_codon:yes stop_codon:yes gene_type:complete